jgi:hypothetical protein
MESGWREDMSEPPTAVPAAFPRQSLKSVDLKGTGLAAYFAQGQYFSDNAWSIIDISRASHKP